MIVLIYRDLAPSQHCVKDGARLSPFIFGQTSQPITDLRRRLFTEYASIELVEVPDSDVVSENALENVVQNAIEKN